MNKCVISEDKLRDISNDAYQIGEDFMYDEQSNARERFIDNLYSYIESISDLKNNDLEVTDQDIDNLANAILNGVFDNYIEEDDILNFDNIKSKVLNVKQGLVRNKTNDSISTENVLRDIEESRDIKERSRAFLDLSYGLAKEVQRQAMLEINTNLFDALFINRGTITDGKLGTVTNSKELNNNIRRLQQQLLDKICAYLKSKNDLTSEEKNLVENATLYRFTDKGYVNTGVLPQIYQLLGRYTTQNKQDPKRLRYLYNKARSGDANAKSELDAYNSYVFLKHFDSYLKLLLDKAITIDTSGFGKKNGKDIYKISDSTADLATTWRTNEDISPEDEIDNITKLAINTTRIYKYGDDSPTNNYMTFQYFQNILGKIKELGFVDLSAQTIVFGSQFYNNDGQFNYIWKTFSDKTKRLIKDKSLASVINYIRQNPIQNLPCIFEILSNQQFYKRFKELSTIFTKLFSSEELDHIYTIHKSVFGSENTLKSLSDSKQELNYYQYIAQASDAIFKNQFVQYFRDENDHVKCRVLTDTEISNQSRKFKNDIISGNRDKSINTKDFVDIYSPNYDGSYFTFNLPGTPIKVTVNPKTETVVYSINDKLLVNFEELIDHPVIQEFLDVVLRLGIKNNAEFLPTYFENTKNVNVGVQQLLDFASNVVARQYFSLNTISKIKDVLERDNKISEIFGDTIKYSKSISQIQLISNSGTSKLIIRNIAKTKAMLNGKTTSTQVKDSQQASQNLQSLSRLIGAYGAQVDLIEKLPESATKNLKFINTPGLFKGHYTTSEYYDSKSKKNKKATKFTVAEMFYSNFVSDYVAGLIDEKEQEYDHIKGGLVSFLASVNSDKGTIGQLYIDMNIRINFNGEKIAVKDLTIPQIKQLIANDFGIMYTEVLKNIESDYKKLFEYFGIIFNEGYSFTKDYVNNFELLNIALSNNQTFVQKYGTNEPVKIIKELVKEYNQIHRFNPIELIDQVHFTGKSKLESNQTLVSQIARFNPSYFKAGELEGKSYPTFDQFFQQKESEIIKDLLKSEFEINLLNGYDKQNKKYSLESNYFIEKHPNWINQQSKKVILAKVTLFNKITKKEETFDIVSKTDLKKIGIATGLLDKDVITEAAKKGTLVLNPELSKYNYLDYFFTQSWMNTTVGSFIAHPDKSKSQNVIEQEASRFQAQHKRNVSMTAQMHPFILNALNGITEEYNVAIIEDIKDLQSTLASSGIDIKPYDGATFVNPFTVYLENNSLGGSRAGFDKKQFIHFKSASTATGGIIKTAGFSINNDRLRQSPNMWHMMRKMTDITWLNDPSNPNSQLHPYATVNILFNNLTNQPIEFGDIYFERKGHYYKAFNIQSLGNNEYVRQIQEVDKRGNPLGNPAVEVFKNEHKINSNFKLWQFFGGAHSLRMTNRGLEYSESSIENVVKVMNSVGTLRYKEDETQYTLNEVETQNEFFQPLKQVDIHYLATAGAVKQGAANINSAKHYKGKAPLDFQRIKMYQAGIQLDKEHHADNAELSLPTQIISAAAALGYTIDKSTALYEGLASAAELGVNELLKATDNLRQNGKQANVEALTEKVLELIAKNLATGTGSSSFATIIANSIREMVHKDPELSYMRAYLPLSDNTVFNKMFSTINSHINNQAIKLKIDGLLAVLTPSHELFKLYGNKTFDKYKDPNVELEIEQQKLDANPNVLIEQNLDYTNQIMLDYNQDYENELQALKQEVNREGEKAKALQAQTNEQRNQIIKNWEEPANLHEYLLRTLPYYYRKVLWDDSGTKRGLKGQVYGRTVYGEDLTSLLWMTSKDGISFDEMIHNIYEGLDLHTSEEISDSDVRDAVLDILLATPTIQQMYAEAVDLEYSKISDETIQAASNLNDLIERPENYRDWWFKEKTGLTYEDYLVRNSPSTQEGLNQCSTNVALERTYKVVYNEPAIYTSLEAIKDHLQTLSEFEQRGDESDEDYEARLNLEANKEVTRLQQEGNTRIEYIFMSLDNYRQLRDDIKSGKVRKVTEFIKAGRNLGPYNARVTTKDRSRVFQLWDLDSIRNVHELLKIQEDVEDVAKNTIKELGKVQEVDAFNQGRIKRETLQRLFKEWYFNRFGFEAGNIEFANFLKTQRIRVQKELENLSESVEDKVEQFDNLVNSGADFTAISNWASLNLTNLQYDQIQLQKDLSEQERIQKVREFLVNNQKIRVDGQLYDIDKSTLDITAYELIMPKTFINEFFNGEEFIDLDAVKQDEDYFIKQALRLKAPKLANTNQYDVELKRGDGNHFYLITQDHLPSTLNPIEDELMTDTIEGKVYRKDIEGNIMYEILPGTKIYTDSNGNEVFVVKDISTISKYIEQLNFNTLNLSQNLINHQDFLLDLVTKLEENKRVGNLILNQVEGNNAILCKSEEIQELSQRYKDSKLVTPESILETFQIWNQVNEYNYKDILKETNPIIKAGRAKYSAFLKSLDVVAARIPSQSLQSFMPMKVVAYDNPNRNSAYVSTLQILLQGSDYDIDAVSIVTFNINSNGNLDLWSPYSNVDTIDNLEESMRLPFPTGKDVEFETTDDATEIVNILSKFRHLLKYNRTKDGAIKVSLININSPQALKTLGELLKITKLSELQQPNGIMDFVRKIKEPITITLDNGQVIQQSILPIDIKHPDDVRDIIKGFAEIINKHNNYLKDTDKHILDKIIKNYTVNQLYDVIKDPANLVQAQTSVDATTEAFKQIANTSAVNEDIKTRTAGNVVNKFEGINDNQVGKDCISICAVGIKGYFALTQYANTVLNTGTDEDQQMLVGSFKTLLSNIRAKNISTVTNQEVLNLLVSAKDMDDQVLALSALLSLSTDNAKELALAKLNAGINMIGAYIYGITVGKDFHEISQWLMSDTGEMLRDIIDENNLQDTPGYGKLRKVFDYFELGPTKHLNKFDSYYDYLDIPSDSADESTWQRTPKERLDLLLNYIITNRNYKDSSKETLLNYVNFKKETGASIANVLKELDSLRNAGFPSSEIDRVRFNQLIDFAQKYAIQYYSVDKKILENIQFLADGAYEMEVLGKIVGLNQGIPTDLSGFLNKCGYLENILERHLDIAKKDKNKRKELNDLKTKLRKNLISVDEYKSELQRITDYHEIDLIRFAFDQNYRKECIKEYEKVKHSFNILAVVDKLPHILKYVQCLAIAKACNQRSYRFRSIDANYKVLSDIHSGYSQDIIKGLDKYLGDQMIQDWMLSEDLEITIPEGNKLFDKNGVMSEKELDFGTTIKLGSEYANASFRKWVEDQVIPDLKKKFGATNQFIRDLGNDTRNNTLSGNGSVVYTLPINMLPRTDQERAIFNIYQDSFNDLATYPYDYEVTRLDNNGNQVIEKKSIDILKIFTLYSMIAHDWRLGESSLVPILEGFQTTGTIKDLHDYIAKLDYSDRTLELNRIELENLKPYLASKKYGSFNTYSWKFNNETEKFELEHTEYNNDLKGKPVKDKIKEYTKSDTNYFPGSHVRSEAKLITQNVRIELEGKLTDLNLQIEWSQGNGNDKVSIKYPNTDKKDVLEDIGNVPVKTQFKNGFRLTTPDIDKIKSLIKRELDNKPETCNTPS